MRKNKPHRSCSQCLHWRNPIGIDGLCNHHHIIQSRSSLCADWQARDCTSCVSFEEAPTDEAPDCCSFRQKRLDDHKACSNWVGTEDDLNEPSFTSNPELVE